MAKIRLYGADDGPAASHQDSQRRHMGKIKRLYAARDASRKVLTQFRNNRTEAIKEYVGTRFSQYGAKTKVVANWIELIVDTYVFGLTGNPAAALVTTEKKKLRPHAYDMALALDRLMAEIQFHTMVEDVTKDALFCMGIAKVGLAAGGQLAIGGELHDVGQPFCDPVSLDDWVHDTEATRMEQADFMGDRYSVRLDEAAEVFDNGHLLMPSASLGSGPARREDRRQTAAIAGKKPSEDVRLFQKALVWDMWIPSDNIVVTLPDEAPHRIRLGDEALHTVDWAGPERGPYVTLRYKKVPESIMPLPPVANLIELHLALNQMLRKQIRQAQRQKSIIAYEGEAADDAENIRVSSDGDYRMVDRIEGIKKVDFGGVDRTSFAMVLRAEQMLNRHAGNIDALAGLAPQSETLGQDQMLLAKASGRVLYMRKNEYEFTQDCMERLAWYMETDPLIDMPLIRRIPGTDVELEVRYTAEEREGDFIDYNFKIQPYSMQHQTPEEISNRLMQLHNQIVMPMLGAGAQGDAIAPILRVHARYLRIPKPDVEDYLVGLGLMPEPDMLSQGGGGPHERTMAPNTTRTNVRVNRSGTVPRAREDQTIKGLLSGSDKKEAANAK